jgi:trans-aconitate methyltransferase
VPLTPAAFWTLNTQQTPGWAASHWDSWTAPHRQLCLNALDLCPDLQSVFEVGCGAGPNLRLIHHRRPEIRLGGADVSPLAAAWARQYLECPIDVQELPECDPSGIWDAVLSMYTLTYLNPDEVRVALKHLTRVASKALLLAEPQPGNGLTEGQQQWADTGQTVRIDGRDIPVVACESWAHDYPQLLDDLGWYIEWRWPVPRVDRLNVMTIARPRG